MSEVQLGTKTSCSDSLPTTAPIKAAISPLSHDYHASSESVSIVSHNTHLSHFQHIESRTQPTITNHKQNRLELNHSSHSNEIPAENPSMYLPHGNSYQLMFEHFEQQQQFHENHYNSTGLIYSTSSNSQTNSEYNDANHLSALWDDYVSYDASQHPYQMNYSDENEYSDHFPGDFPLKCIGNYAMEDNYNVLCNV